MSSHPTQRGILYIATGHRHIVEARHSAASVRAVMPGVPIALLTSEPVIDKNFERIQIIDRPAFDYLDKVSWMQKSPYRLTLFLDTDTYVCRDIAELFLLIERFDIAAAHASNRVSRGPNRLQYPLGGIPAAFPEMNTGVILFRKTRNVERLFAAWLAFYEHYLRDPDAPRHDQPAFRRALYGSDLRIATLPSEYNFRFKYPAFASGEVKVLHGRHPDVAGIARGINRRVDRRVFIPEVGLWPEDVV